jgi:hypothetical protein
MKGCKRQYHRKEVLTFDDAKGIPTAEDADKRPETTKLKPAAECREIAARSEFLLPESLELEGARQKVPISIVPQVYHSE